MSNYCPTCKHSRPALLTADDGDLVPGLECWRFPPTVAVFDGDVITLRPEVSETDTCGEHDHG